MAKDAYWFSHDSNAKDDPKCMVLIDQLGLEGYGIYWVLVETLREQPEYKYPLHLLPVLAKRYFTSGEKFQTVVRNYGLFCVSENDFFFSDSLNNRMQHLENTREKRKQAALSRWNKTDANAMQLQCKSNALPMLSKVKESKVKESKKEYIPESFLLNEFCKQYFDVKFINNKSLETFDNLIRIDNYSLEQVKSAIIYGRTDDFWRSNFLTPNKLREKNKEGVKYIDIFLAKAIKPKPQVQQACR